MIDENNEYKEYKGNKVVDETTYNKKKYQKIIKNIKNDNKFYKKNKKQTKYYKDKNMFQKYSNVIMQEKTKE